VILGFSNGTRIRVIEYESEMEGMSRRKKNDSLDHDTTASYETFKVQVMALYPATEEALNPSLTDLERLITDQAQTPIRSQSELGNYDLEFQRILQSLIEHAHISPVYQACQLLASLELPVATVVHTRLMHKFPDRHPDDVYITKDVYKATLYVLALQSNTHPQVAEDSHMIFSGYLCH
jgi:hypothetical protein